MRFTYTALKLPRDISIDKKWQLKETAVAAFGSSIHDRIIMYKRYTPLSWLKKRTNIFI